MPVKKPVNTTVTVDVHTRPVQPDDSHLRQPVNPPHPDLDTLLFRRRTDSRDSASTSDSPDLDAITPVVVAPIPSGIASTSPTPPAPRPLIDYRVSTAVNLPKADAEGFLTIKGRRFVEVADIGIVAIATDAATGLHRARLASELQPSGPVLIRDQTSKLWQPLDDSPITFILSENRLLGFRTALDFADAEPGPDGLHRHDGKLYVVIDNHAYQALHDLDASTPLTPVMRIVRAQDAVAGDSNNRYVATRAGQSEPVVFDAVDGWMGVTIPGAGGMHRSADAQQGTLADRFRATLNRLKSPSSRVRKLYPAFTEQQVSALITSLGADVQNGLARRETDYKNLKKALAVWSLDNTQPDSQSAGQEWITSTIMEIKRCWRQESGPTLKLAAVAGVLSLPPLKADFGHVNVLELDSVTWSEAADTFLASFSGLQGLTVKRSTLEKLPDAIGSLHDLTALSLQSNRLQLDERSAASLARLDRLEHLDLSGNPLGKTPDFSAMADLKTVNLSNTGIEQWPSGLQQQSGLELLDLRQNKLSEVPETILNPPADQLQARARINGVTRLEGNRFAPDYWKSLEAFWERVSTDHPELATPVNLAAFRLNDDIPEVAMVRRMYPEKDPQAARAYLMSLDEAAQKGLVERVQEFDLMQADLEDYIQKSSSIGVWTKRWAERVASTLKTCWLRESGDTLEMPHGQGPLPALNADFSHIRALSLQDINWSVAADQFLSNFAKLEKLAITGCDLKRLPAGIGEMRALTHLNLSSNKLVLDEQAAATISGLTSLSVINLSTNPLHIAPDFSAMSGLVSLSLYETGITHWPAGLQDKTALKYVDLRNNQLKEVPQAHLDPSPEQLLTVTQVNRVISMEGNDFPPDYWRKFDDYWRRVNEVDPELLTADLGTIFDSENSPAQRYHNLYPDKNIKHCREYLWSLGDEDAARQVTRLEQEYRGLKRQLEDWEFSGGGSVTQYTPARRLAANAQHRSERLKASIRIINCWRRLTPQKLANDQTPIGLELDLSGLRLPSLPDLDADFSHVGSLRLSNMALSTSPEGFLTRFRHLRWLELSYNQLRELPPAIEEMTGLTRLFLQENQIALTVETARVLSGRTTLRALWLHGNPRLGIVPDFGRMTDLRSLNLSGTGIDTFPTGIAEQPLLDTFNLSNNQIADIPDEVIAPPDERLAHTARINNVTNILNNPLSEATQARLTLYSTRLNQAETPLHGPTNLIDTARGHVHRPLVVRTTADSLARWTVGMSEAQVATRKVQWQTLHEQQASGGLFDTLDRLLLDSAGRQNQQQRVWKLIDSITENTEPSENLRKEVFDRAGEATCCDRAAFTFANLETRAMMHHALAKAGDKAQGPQLTALSRALFRLHEVDKIASADIARREATIAAERTPQDAARLSLPHVPEEVEIRLYYRHALRDRLQLPGQPESMGFSRLIEVQPEQVEAAYNRVVALDDSPEELQELVSREFWQKFITSKYQDDFVKQRQPIQEQQSALDDLHASNQLALADYQTQSSSLQASWIVEEAALIETLTRQELAEYAARGTGEEATDASV